MSGKSEFGVKRGDLLANTRPLGVERYRDEDEPDMLTEIFVGPNAAYLASFQSDKVKFPRGTPMIYLGAQTLPGYGTHHWLLVGDQKYRAVCDELGFRALFGMVQQLEKCKG